MGYSIFSIIALAASLLPSALLAQEGIRSAGMASCSGNSGYVNLFMGTAGDHGQVAPAAQVPFGMVSVCPDNNPHSHSGYDYDVTSISGISVDRMSGVGGEGSGGNLRLRPARKDSPLEIVKGTEKAVPGFYSARLDNGVAVCLTASENIAFELYRFPGDAEKVLYADFNSGIDTRKSECSWKQLDDKNIEGWVKTSTVCNFGAYKLYFRLNASESFVVQESSSDAALLDFGKSVNEVEVRIALSPIDEISAAEELELASGKTFSETRKGAAAKWEDILSSVDVSGSTREQKELFYTGLYRICLSPFNATSNDGRYRGSDGQLRTVQGWTYYSGWSMWDTFRTKFPMFCLLFPDRMQDFSKSLVKLYSQGKRNWATSCESVPTVRTEHSQITLLDAWSKGIRDFDFSEAFPAMEQEYLDGMIPGTRQGLLRKSPDQKMETVYDLWAMSEIASVIGNVEAAEKYSGEADELFEKTWKEEFMDINEDFAKMKGNGMYQGTRWQYRWAMPLFVDRMIEWAGRERLAGELDEFFRCHHFNQGNEPDIQTPFMFNSLGYPERTDSLVYALLTDDHMIHRYGGSAEFNEPFIGRAFRSRPDGYAPEMDEDDGTMSAWYMFCQMGLYPLCAGTDMYELFTPLFKKVTIHFQDHDLVIRRTCAEASASRVLVDGLPLEDFRISHSQLIGASEILFE